MLYSRITVNPLKMDGVPCIRDIRIPIATVVGMVADGMTFDAILKALPDLEHDDIKETLQFNAN